LGTTANKAALERERVLTTEEDALRRVAMLVARGASVPKILDAVTEQVARIFALPWVGVMRYDSPNSFVVVATWGEHPFAVGSRWPLDGPSTFASVLRTGRPAALDYAGLSGTVAQAAQESGIVGGIGAPILVDGVTWGVLAVPATRAAPIPAGAETRLSVFTELVASAISNAEARDARAALADEQAALRRLATLVASESSPVAIFSAVAVEARRVLAVEAVGLLRFEPDETATLVAQSDTPWDPPPLGTRFTLDGDNVVVRLFHTGRTVRVDDWADSTGAVAAMASVLGVRSAVAAPVIVEDHLWGTIIVASSRDEPLPGEIESRIRQFTPLVATTIANAQTRARLAHLAEEQAALRRVAVLVAEQASPQEVFTAVTEVVGPLLGADLAAMLVFREDVATVIASWSGAGPSLLIGTELPLDGDSATARIFRTGAAARIDGYADAEGGAAEVARELRLRTTVGAPILTEGKLWGALMAATRGDEPLPEDVERRIAAFTELVATAVSNAQARGELERLADEQAALRRVATFVAHGVEPEGVFRAVAFEVGVLFGADVAAIVRFEDDDTVTVLGDVGGPHVTGKRVTLDEGYVVYQVRETGRSARFDTNDPSAPNMPSLVRTLGIRSSVATPIVVEDELWGAITAASVEGPLPPSAERWLTEFTELVATAVANTQARERVASLAEEQAALRRVATLVAVDASQEEIFDAVAVGVAGALGEELRLVRFEGDMAVVVATSQGPHMDVLPVGTRLPIGGNNALSHVSITGEPTRIDDYSQATGPIAESVRAQGLRSIVATPVVVEGRTWGAMIVGTFVEQPVPLRTEGRLGQFAELMATSIANTEARAEIERLAAEQAALSRVATLVAEGVPPQVLVSVVADEVAYVLGAEKVWLIRYEPEEVATVVASINDDAFPVGSRWSLDGPSVTARVFRTGLAARIDDYGALEGTIAGRTRDVGITSAVAIPITVDGRAWGAVCVATTEPEPLPADVDARLSNFAGLVATAVSNASARSQLIASRARIVSAGDEARRRIERNLHDGTQQRLIALGLDLQRTRATIPDDQAETHAALVGVEEDLEAILVDLRELSHGLHPQLLSRLGLGPSLRALARRSPIPVRLDVDVPVRPEASAETAVYYVVSEALTNAIKHSQASEISVTITSGDKLQASIVDDGVGAADPSSGSGLTGLLDRIDALGGRFSLDSPPRGGTRISVELPVEPAAAS
jgi:GAF domain-containing protein